MEKNWLIRTKSCHILGPVSREKVIELWQNGSIKPEDEICSGNGHWIWLRESDLVERYLMSGEKQGFNPICEAPTVFGDLPAAAVEYSDDITLITPRALGAIKKESEEQLPSSTMKVSQRTAELLKPKATASAPTEAVIRAPEPAARPSKREYSASPTPVTPGRQPPRRRTSDDPRPVTVLRPRRLVSDRTFMIGSLVALIALAAMFYYRKQIITSFLQSAARTVLPEAHAQESVAKKKTSSLTF